MTGLCIRGLLLSLLAGIVICADTCPDDCINCICGVLSNDGDPLCGEKWIQGDVKCGKGCQKIGKQCGCGPFGITKAYFRKCKKLTTLPIKGYKGCVTDVTCAKLCICAFISTNLCVKQQPTCDDIAHVHYMKGLKNKRNCKLKKSKIFRKSVRKCLQSKAPVTPAPVTPAPITPAPVTPAPETPAPITPAPVTPAPIAPSPVTPAPITPAPVTPAPIAPSPVTPAPVTHAPVTPATVTPALITPTPVTPAPITPASVTPAPITPAPITPAPVTPAPVTPAPVTPAPITPAPITLAPVTATQQCTPLLPQPYDITSPGEKWGNNSDLQNTFPPERTGFVKPVPTHHFTINQAKKNKVPIVLFPYIAIISPDGVTYDSQPLDRWSDPDRQMLRLQATPNANTWKKFPDIGVHTDQVVTGPDGNPFAWFWRSGIKVSMTGQLKEPVWEEYGDLYAHWKIEENNGNGTIEVPMVRGSALLTNIFTEANPKITPYCLTSVNGVSVQKFFCPMEEEHIDKGSGYLDGSYCSNGKLHMILRMTKPRDVAHIQWAANSEENWSGNHYMHNCGPECVSSDGGKRIDITVDAVTGPSNKMAFAINNIYYYTVPARWIDEPEIVTCATDRRKRSINLGDKIYMAHAQENVVNERQKRDTTVDLGSGNKFNLELDEPGNKLPDQTRKFVLYFSETVKASYEPSNGLIFTLASGNKFSGIVKVGYLGAGQRGDQSNDNFLDPYRHTYSYKPTVNYCVNGDSATVEFDWNKQGNGPLLMSVLPHQNDMLQNLIDTPSVFKGHVGDKWSLEYSLPPASLMPDQNLVNQIKNNPSQLQDIVTGLDHDTTTGLVITWSCDVKNSYFAGKDIAMATRAASISRAFGTNHFNTIDPAIKNCLEKWLRINDVLDPSRRFQYETVWGGLTMKDQGSFGFDKYNDHHFHLGYWIYAIAYYSKYYQQWAQAHLEEILFLARDVGNPSTADPYFPPVRHKDIYLGHSWASGIHIWGRDQESSSESINCYHALAALGESLAVIDNKFEAMRDFGRIWLAMEIKSVRQYYQVRDTNFDQFPPFIQKFGSIGMFSEHAVFIHNLHFGCVHPNVFPSRHGCLKGIQVLPVTAVSNYFMDEGWAKHVNMTCQWAINPLLFPDADKIDPIALTKITFGWGVLCMVASSAASPEVTQQAIDFIHNKPQNEGFEGGSGYASTMLFLHGRT